MKEKKNKIHKISIDSFYSAKSIITTPSNEGNSTDDNSSSGKGRRRLYTSDHIKRPSFLPLIEEEDMLINLSKKQRKMSNYSEDENSLGFTSRENSIDWCLRTLDSFKLTNEQKVSIFHRFCTAYDYIMEKLFSLNKLIKNEKELKIQIITIFLLSYKLEGYSLAKLSVYQLVDTFLQGNYINRNTLQEEIIENEMKILELLDFNPQIFDDNNIHQLSFILLDLFIRKYSIKFEENEEKRIKDCLEHINEFIEFSDKMLFKFLPFDKAITSFYSVVEYCSIKNKNILDSLENFYKYLRKTLKIIKISKEDFDKYCIKFAKNLNKNKM